MALSGNLSFVPLDEVLRLLTRSDQQGSVDVWGQDVRGRIFITRKGIGLATTSDDRDLRRHLVNSGYVDEASAASLEAGNLTLAPLSEKQGEIIDLLREMTVESLYQMTHKGTSFEVTESATTPYASPRPFELEAVLEDARRRASEWSEVEKVLADLEVPLKMNRDLGELDSVKISREAWRLLCELGAGSSVRSIAERLGTTEFWTARVGAGLMEQHLLAEAETEAEAEAEVEPEPEPIVEPSPVYQAPTWSPQPVETPAAEVEAEEPTAEPEPEPGDHDASWWTEPEPAAVSEEPEVAEPDTAPTADTASSSRFGLFAHKVESTDESAAAPVTEPFAADGESEAPAEVAEPSTPDLEAVEEDTEAFLEKVFSQLEPEGQPEEEGHGLLRRRRLGVIKELADDN